MKPHTIQIFLPDGSSTSIRGAEITKRLLKAILFPRIKNSRCDQERSVSRLKVEN